MGEACGGCNLIAVDDNVDTILSISQVVCPPFNAKSEAIRYTTTGVTEVVVHTMIKNTE